MGQENQRTQELAETLRAVFAMLRETEVDYCVLRNYEELPDYTGHDVDILVAQPHLERALAALRHTCRRHGWKLLAETTRMGNHSLYFYYDRSPRVQLLTIDVVVELTWGWMPTCDVSRTLAAKTNYRGIPVAAPGGDAAARVMKTVLRGQLPEEKAWAKIREFTRLQADLFRDVLGGCVDAKVVQKLIDCIEADDRQRLGRLGRELRRSVFRHATLRRPATTAWDFLVYAADRARLRRGRSLGMTVALVGPDGIGKTSLAERLSARVGELLFRGTDVYHGGFNILPRLNLLLRKAMGVRVRQIDFTQKHSGSDVKPHSPLRSLLYLTYYSLDYFLGRFKTKSLKAKGRLVLFDRYYYDYYFQRRNAKLPRWILDFFRRFVPAPDVVLLLEADPAVVYRRKPELREDDIRRAIETAACVGKSLAAETSVRTVRTDRGEELAEDEAARAILSTLHERNFGANQKRRAA